MLEILIMILIIVMIMPVLNRIGYVLRLAIQINCMFFSIHCLFDVFGYIVFDDIVGYDDLLMLCLCDVL